MPKDLHGLSITAMAVHEIRKGAKGAGTSALLTDQLSDLTPDLCDFFEDRIILAASSDDSFAAEFLSDTNSPVPVLCDELLNIESKELLGVSRASALHLATVQPGSGTSGLLAVASAVYGGHAALVFLKLEHDQGVKIERKEVDGKRIVALEHVRDLILSTRTRLHKQAFIQRSADGYFLEVADKQRGYEPSTSIARYFLTRFLGARTLIDAREATKRFVDAVEILTSGLSDAKRQSEIRLDLASALKSKATNIVPKQFAQEHLAPEEMPVFDEALTTKGVPANFTKDAGLVESTVSKLRMIGEHGIVFSAPTEVWKQRVTVSSKEAGSPEVTVVARDIFKVD